MAQDEEVRRPQGGGSKPKPKPRRPYIPESLAPKYKPQERKPYFPGGPTPKAEPKPKRREPERKGSGEDPHRGKPLGVILAQLERDKKAGKAKGGEQGPAPGEPGGRDRTGAELRAAIQRGDTHLTEGEVNVIGMDPDLAALGNSVVQTMGPNGAAQFQLSSKKYRNQMVFMGEYRDTGMSRPRTMAGGGVYGWEAKEQVSMTMQEALDQPNQWTDAQMREFVNKGITNKLEGFHPGMGMPEIMEQWSRLVENSVKFNATGTGNRRTGSMWTPMDVLTSYNDPSRKLGTQIIDGWEYDLATGERLRYVGPKSRLTKTDTDKAFDLSSTEDVAALTRGVLTELLGRRATPEEVAQFKTSLNAMEQANPTVRTTTTKLSPNVATGEFEQLGSESTTTGGITQAAREEMVAQQVEKTPEYAKYQAATTYWNAMMQMINGG